MRLILSDLRPLLLLAPLVLALLVLLAALEWRSRWRPSGLLTATEWVLCGKLVAIPLLVLVLVAARVALSLPLAQFLYGRF